MKDHSSSNIFFLSFVILCDFKIKFANNLTEYVKWTLMDICHYLLAFFSPVTVR